MLRASARQSKGRQLCVLDVRGWTQMQAVACVEPGARPWSLRDRQTVAIGDPLEFGEITTGTYGDDNYRRVSPPLAAGLPTPPAGRSDYVASHQEYDPPTSSGGFPSGMLRIDGCANLPPEAKCGRVAATDSISASVMADPSRVSRFDQNRRIAFLRPRQSMSPGLYCTAPYPTLPGDAAKGTCIPPYFVFQFRVDGQPSSFGDPNPYWSLADVDELSGTDDIWPAAGFVDTERRRFNDTGSGRF